jgi:hypothetical protein
VDEVAASLGGNKSEAEGLAAQLAASKQQAEELQGQLAALGAEGAANLASAAVQTIEGLMSEAAGLAGRIGEAQAQVLAIRQGSLLTRGTAGTATTPVGSSSAPTFNPRKFDPTKLAGLRRYSEAGTAEGKLYRSDGSPHSDRVLRARPPGSSPFPPGSVRGRYRDTTPNRGHIEGEVAATMHRDQLNEATLYLNAEPCDNRGQGCKENTHAFVPEGSVLNIWAVNDDGSRVFKRVNGTGEAFNGQAGN